MLIKNSMSLSFRFIIVAFIIIGFFVAFMILFSEENLSVGSFLLLAITGTIVSVGFFQAKVYARKIGSRIKIGLFPIFKKTLPVDDIQDVSLIDIPSNRRIEREWGSRGRFSGEGGLFLDCRSSSLAVRLLMNDGKIFDLGVGHDKRAAFEMYSDVACSVALRNGSDE